MLTLFVLATVLAAGAQAVAAPEPQITPPPSLKNRRDLGDIFDSVTSAVGNAASDVGDVASDIGQGIDCADKVEDFFDDQPAMPTATGRLGTILTSYLGDNGNYCAGTAVPSDLSQSYQQYESDFVSWYSSVSPAIQSAANACPSLPTEFQNAIQPCSTALSAANVTPVAFDGQPNSSDDNATPTTDDGNAAPHVTGVVPAAAALAFGAVAALL